MLHRIRDQYLHKVPEIAEIIADQFTAFGCEHLLAELEPSAALAPPSSGTLWTPNAEAAANPAASLWLPGQS